VELHDGAIAAESGGPGAGTTVTIRLPIASAFGAAPERAVWHAVAPMPLPAAMVVVVDDQADSREMIATFLEQRGVQTRQCGTADAVLEVLRTESVDLLIADLAMPNVDGYELIRRVRACGCGVPAIAVTAFARADDRRRALENGFTRYLVKPVDATELARAVEDVLTGVRPAVV
jgi:CheY-like chemotaxis protein